MQQLNPQIRDILIEHKINTSIGALILLGIYYNLDISKLDKEEEIKAINLTKIVEKDYRNNDAIKWNVPLFATQATPFDWVSDWMTPWNKYPDKKATLKDVLSRMQKFFAENPDVRKEDVYKARDAYFRTVNDPKFLIMNHYFIFKDKGADRTSTLHKWVQHVKQASTAATNQKGKIVS